MHTMPHPYNVTPLLAHNPAFDMPLPPSGKRGTPEAAWEAERVLKSRHIKLPPRKGH